jgi:hypothetical protein
MSWWIKFKKLLGLETLIVHGMFPDEYELLAYHISFESTRGVSRNSAIRTWVLSRNEYLRRKRTNFDFVDADSKRRIWIEER